MDLKEGGGVYDTEKQNGSFVLKLLLKETTGISAVRNMSACDLLCDI